MRKNKALVSVVVPVYNTEEFLQECVESILEQTYTNLEIILVNDGSTDKSPAICDEFAKNNSFVTVLHQKNKGVSAARNAGIKHATGDYITFIDADDAIHPSYVAFLVDDMLQFDATTVTTAAKDVPSKNQGLLNAPVQDAEILVMDVDQTILELYRGMLEGTRNGVQMFSLRMLKDNKVYYDESMAVGEDFDFFARAILASNKVVIDKRRMYFYRSNPSSVMLQTFNKKQFDAIKNVEGVGRTVEDRIPGLKEAIDTMVFSDAIFYGAKMINNHSSWPKEYQEIMRIIKQYRFMVLFNKYAKRNTRIKALIVTIFGPNLGLKVAGRLIRW